MSAADSLPETLRVKTDGAIAHLTLDRAHKRNALDDETVLGIGAFFDNPPDGTRVVILDAAGDHFSAGLDLNSLTETSTFDGVLHSRMWHRAFSSIEQASTPVIAVLKGAVIGGGLELAAAAHIRVAEPSAFYSLPEGRRGLFVGGGAAVRIPRLIGVHRMTDLMLTGRVLSAQEGQQIGISHYLVDTGDGLVKACELAARIAENASISNFAILNALPRIAQGDPEQGYFTEALMAAIAQGSEESKEMLRAFLAGAADKVAATHEGAEDA